MARIPFGIVDDESLKGTGFHDPSQNIVGPYAVKFFVKRGDRVVARDRIAEIGVEKAVIDVTAPTSGVIVSLNETGEWGSEGVTKETPCGKLFMPPLGEIETNEEEVPDEKDAENNAIERQTVDISTIQNERIEVQPPAKSKKDETEKNVFLAVPAARHYAREKNIDLSSLSGTGETGIIQASDIKESNDIEERHETETEEKRANISLVGKIDDGRIVTPASLLRKTAARRFEKSWREIPHVGGSKTVDVTTLRAFMKESGPYIRALIGVQLRYDVLFMYLAKSLLLLSKFKVLNGYWDKEKEAIITFPFINMGIAVQIERGLMVPVIHRMEHFSLEYLAKTVEEKITRAVLGKCMPHDFYNLTFTVNNTGVLGVESPQPIIPYTGEQDGSERPTGFILALGEIVKNDSGRSHLSLVYRFDHRYVDAAIPGAFVGMMKKYIESTYEPKEFLKLFTSKTVF